MTPRRSVRAAARRFYEERVGEGGPTLELSDPHP